MKIIQLQLCVLICCHAAVADLLTDSGSKVSINCDLDENEVYWILMKTPDPPTVILQSTSTSTFYANSAFINKYSVEFKNCLVINNVTADELGVYYCMNTETPPKLSKTTRICITESAQLTECNNQNQKQCQIIIITSGLINGLLLILLIGLLNIFVRIRRSAEQSRQCNTALQQTQVTEQQRDSEELQYATVDFSKLRKNRSSQVNSTYAALNLPKS